jgi:MFS transporter, ACS family, glucarate transporter
MKPAYSSLLRPTGTRFIVLAFICTLSMLTYLDRVCISRVQGDIQTDLRLTDLQLGLVFSAFLWGYTLFEVPGGWMGDRWGSRRVLLRIVLWWSVFTALTGAIHPFSIEIGSFFIGSQVVQLVFNGFLALVLVRFLFGCGEAGAYPNLARVVGSWFPFRERGLAQGAIWTSARLGGAVAPLVIGQLTRFLDWRRAFWVLGLMGAAWCLAFAWWFRDRPEDQPGCNEAERDLIRSGPYSWDASASAAAREPVPWKTLLTSVNLWAICLAAFCISFGWYFYPTWQPRFLKEIYHIDYKDSEIITGLPFLCGALGCFLGGYLSDRLVRVWGRRWGRSLFGLVGYAGAGLCVLATGFVHHPAQAVVLLCLAFFINDLAVPVIWAIPADIAGRHAGTVAGMMNMAGGLGGMLIPILIPVLLLIFPAHWSNHDHWKGIFAVMASAWFIGAIAWLRINAAEPLPAAGSPRNTAL